MAEQRRIRAVLFDFMGTCLDWCSIVTEGLPHTISHDERQSFALLWRVEYFRENERRLRSGMPTENIDITLQRTLKRMLNSDRLPLSDEDISTIRQSTPSISIPHSFHHLAQHFNAESDYTEAIAAWHRQKAWPDVGPALKKLKEEHGCEVFVHANGTTRLQLDLIRSSGLQHHFDLLMSSQMLGQIKPAPEPYKKAFALLEREPDECLMVAAHVADVRGAKAVGMRTVYIRRWTDDIHEDLTNVEGEFDAVLDDMHALSDIVKRLNGYSS